MSNKASVPKLKFINALFLFFMIFFLVGALFFAYAPYEWVCELFQMSEGQCILPKWSIILISLGFFFISYLCRYNFDFEEMFYG